MAKDGTRPFVVGENLGYALSDGRVLFSNLDISIGREKVGLVGPNGMGKSTILRMLVGELTPSSGAVRRDGTVGYLPQNPYHQSMDTVADGLGVRSRLEAIARIEAGRAEDDDFEIVADDWDVVARTEAVLGSLGLDALSLSRKMTSVSGGEIVRVLLGRLLLERSDLLLLDEPTNNLDRDARGALYRTVEQWKNGVLVVTHDRELLMRVSRILRLSSHGLKSYGGNFDDFVAQLSAEEDAAGRRLEHAQRELKKLKRQVQENREKHQRREAKGVRERKTGSQPMLFHNAQRERSERSLGEMNTQVERMMSTAKAELDRSRAEVEIRERISVDLDATRVPDSKLVLDLEDVSFGYPGRPLFEHFDMKIIGPERVAIQGRNGAGKSTLLRLITGDAKPDSGTVKVGVDRVAFLDQRALVLDHEKSILENFLLLNPDMTADASRQQLAHFLFTRDDVFKLVRVLSGGEVMRAMLACLLMAKLPPNLILLDEPTNHLDMEAIESVEHTLGNYQGSIVVVSHDDRFLRNVGVERRIEVGEQGENRRK